MRKLACMTLAVFLLGCSFGREEAAPKYQTVAVDPRRNTEEAKRMNGQAVQDIEAGKLDAAEEKLKAALDADIFFGPAHNNLGMVYYRQEKYYVAAWELQYAAKLMPGKAEPLHNIGLVFEAVGKLDEAAENYEKALVADPEAMEPTCSLARLRVRQNKKDDRTRGLLEKIVMREDRPEWIEWARERLSLIGRPKPTTQPAESMPMDLRGG